MCNKKRFDKIGAMLAVAKAKNSPNSKRQENRYYLCSNCGSYHLTSQPFNKALQNKI
jgi:hypothetical protein